MDFFCCENALNIPNLLTFVRVGMLPAIVWRFRLGDFTGALILYIIAMLTDVIDGWVARRFHQITALGKLFDPLADKLCLMTMLGLFAADGQIPPWLFIAVLIKEFILTVGSVYALKKGIVVSALPIGKVTTASFVGSVVLRFINQRLAADILLALSFLFSVIALAWYGIAFIHQINLRYTAYPIHITKPLS